MPKKLLDTGSARPFLDIARYARRGPGQRDRLSHEEIPLVARTVRRAPEVMVKVLSRGEQDIKAVGQHFAYLGRKGDLAVETDDAQELRGKGAEADLLKDWHLDIQAQRPTSSLVPGLQRKAPKLVHKVLFSMPPGTSPQKVLEAVKVFAREEFSLRHRYAMILHTDEPHPHIHVVIKAVSEQGVWLPSKGYIAGLETGVRTPASRTGCRGEGNGTRGARTELVAKVSTASFERCNVAHPVIWMSA
jgi:hypothetical protein